MINFKAIFNKNDKQEIESVEVEIKTEPFNLPDYRKEVEDKIKDRLIEEALYDWIYPELSSMPHSPSEEERELMDDELLACYEYNISGFSVTRYYNKKSISKLVGEKIIKELKEQGE